MKKLLGILVLGLILFSQLANAIETKWMKGSIYENEITWIKDVKFKLPKGQFKLIGSDQWSSWGILINGKWLMNMKGNLFHQDIGLARIGSGSHGSYLKVIYEEIFFKNKYDGCYPRSEYTVMKRRKKGGFFNCFLVRHYDVQKELHYPDDPQDKENAVAKYIIKKNNIEFPPIILCHESLFYASSITDTVLAFDYCINPETNGASKTLRTTEDASEYHPQNINKFPDKKKFMEKFIKLSAQRHKFFEREIKAKEHHKLDLSEYGIGDLIEETKTTISSSGSGLTEELQELYELYKEGVLTKEEFQKAKKKVLSQ